MQGIRAVILVMDLYFAGKRGIRFIERGMDLITDLILPLGRSGHSAGAPVDIARLCEESWIKEFMLIITGSWLLVLRLTDNRADS